MQTAEGIGMIGSDTATGMTMVGLHQPQP